MSQPPATSPQHTFDPAQPTAADCALCRANNRLKGGEILAEGKLFYAYVFVENGVLIDNFIAPHDHHPDMRSLPPNWGDEFASLYYQLLSAFGINEHNAYWSKGFGAGARVPGHWHVRVVRAPDEGSPSWGMGLALLRRKYDELVGKRRIRNWVNRLKGKRAVRSER